ncbi:hypothetical protein [Catenuloplanes japonicus]|uniref:hypothetical protein n=1 Tax=Catenuloplanes japonicus TaxID=33876 RepID=UPI000526A380|nr:hypothetical protein [Catenuloplanes japonicus]
MAERAVWRRDRDGGGPIADDFVPMCGGPALTVAQRLAEIRARDRAYREERAREQAEPVKADRYALRQDRAAWDGGATDTGVLG